MVKTKTAAGQQGRVGAVAGEVLADRDLHAAEAGEDDADPDRGRVAADDADHQRDDAGEDGQLGQRHVAPGRRRPLVWRGARGAALLVRRRGAPPCASLNGRKPPG